jgi:hypothetical protein
MPFSPELDIVYEQLIRPALDGYDVARADSRLDERSILEKIVTGIHDADIVIADLTFTNANVMYELGIAHALGKPTIMIAQSLHSLPFDVRAYPVHEYTTHFARAAELRTTLAELGEHHRAGLLRFSNPVTDFVPQLAALSPEPQSSGEIYTVADCLRDIELATTQIATFGSAYETAAAALSRRMAVAVPAIAQVATHEPNPERKSAIADVANVIRDHAGAIDSIRRPMREAWERYSRATLRLAAPPQIVQLPPEQRAFFASEARAIDALLNGMIGNVAAVRAANDRTPKLTGNLEHAVEAAHAAQTSLLNEIMTGKAYLAQIISSFEGTSPESA